MEETEFIQSSKALFNDIVMYGDHDVYRLIGCHVGNDEYYYVLRTLHGQVEHCSAVGAIVSLKGVYPRYKEMENLFSINLCPQAPEFYFSKDERYAKCPTCKNVKDYWGEGL